MAPTSIDGTDISSVTIDGTEVQEITADGQVVYTAIPDPVTTQFDNPSDWTISSENGDAEFTTDSTYVKSGSYAFLTETNNNDAEHIVTSDTEEEALFGEANFYYYTNNNSFYSFGVIVREQSAGGEALGAVVNRGTLELIEGTVGSYTELKSTSAGVNLTEGSFNEVTIAVREGDNNPYATVTVDGESYQTAEAESKVTSKGRFGIGMPNAGSTGGNSSYDDLTFTYL